MWDTKTATHVERSEKQEIQLRQVCFQNRKILR